MPVNGRHGIDDAKKDIIINEKIKKQKQLVWRSYNPCVKVPTFKMDVEWMN
ncbi:MAG: hypothetical protein ABH950_07490 [Candidatus Altiarchaeota archaeon]